MWIRNQNGHVFHKIIKVHRKTRVSPVGEALCGVRVRINYLAEQITAEGEYVRCAGCRRLEVEEYRRKYAKVYGLTEGILVLARKVRRGR